MPQQHVAAHIPQYVQEVGLGFAGIHIQVGKGVAQVIRQHPHNGVGVDIHAEGGGNGIGIHSDHILKAQLILLVLRAEGLAREYVDGGVRQLIPDDLRLGRGIHHIFGQLPGVGNACGHQRSRDTLPGAHDANDLQFLPGSRQIFHIASVAGHILPDPIFSIIAVEVSGIHQAEFQFHQLFVLPLHRLLIGPAGLPLHDGLHLCLQLGRTLHAQGIGHIVGDTGGIRQNKDHFRVILRPPAPDHLILGFQQFPVVDHFIEHIGVHVGTHSGTAGEVGKQAGGIGLDQPLPDLPVDGGPDAVAVAHHVHRMFDFAVILLQIGLEGCQVIPAHLGEHGADHLLLPYHALRQLGGLGYGGAEGRQGRGHIRRLLLQGQGVIGQGIRLDLVDVFLKARGQRHDQGDTDDADGARKGGQQSSGQLGSQVIEA